MIKHVNNKKYKVFSNEFEIVPHKEYNNLKIFKTLGIYERLISFLSEIKNIDDNISQLICINTTHGGFIPIECSKMYKQIFLFETNINQEDNILSNKKLHNIENIYLNEMDQFIQNNINIVFAENSKDIPCEMLERFLQNSIIITDLDIRIINNQNYIKYELTNSNYIVYLNHNFENCFKTYFNTYIVNYTLNYDNLINLCIMVKNGGPQFEQMLIDNLSIIDRWTILDTGSTDNTIDTINKILVGKKSGNLYKERFINFCDSRNMLLELAGTVCKFNIMLDDTYVVEGNLRSFLNEVRGDQYSNSFTLIVKSNDTQYGSNRIIKSESGLKYMYRIHEVITDKNNINIIIPENKACICDKRFDYMEKRTMERKNLDLKLLYEELEEDPMNPRTYYYLAQTYNLLEEYEKAYNFFLKRAEFINCGFIQERFDAIFEAARLANFKLNKNWSICLELYEKALKIDETRPETFYFIGIHYYLENNYKEAYAYLKQGFEVGFPTQCQYSLKPSLSFHFLPKFLTRICYEIEDYTLGERASYFFLTNNTKDSEDYYEILSWYNIYKKINMYNGPKIPTIRKITEKPLFCFVADGGFEPWTGSTILTTGVGGSETYIIEMARWIQQMGKFNVIVFCNTPNGESETFEEVEYKNLKYYYEFINTNYVHTCIVSRFSEYLPVTFKGWCENVYLVVHDLTTSGIVIPIDKKLKNIFCLTEWHVDYFTQIFPLLKNITVPFYYGLNNNFKKTNTDAKIPYKFIYSSFPNRGLLILLQMWPKIYNHQPLASLHIYCDINGKWVNNYASEQMIEIRKLLDEYKRYDNNLNIHYYGWVSKNELAEAWKTSDIWFYPCTFMETFCLTALEAASSKTFIITNDLAGLQNTVGDRGVIIKGDATTTVWQEEALKQIFFYLNEINIKNKNELVEKNFKWTSKLTWEAQANKLINEYILNYSNINLNNILNNVIYINLYENDYHILKIGAYKGNVMNDDVYYNINSNTKVIFVEPVPSYFYQLKENYNNKCNNNNFIYINKAVSNFIGKINMFYPSITNNFETLPWWIEQLASIHKNHCKDHGYDIDLDSILVNTTTINEIANDLDIKKIILLIVDTEGHDFDIIMNIDFSIIKPKFIKFENMHLSGYKNKGNKYNILLSYLQNNGYILLDENVSDTLVCEYF